MKKVILLFSAAVLSIALGCSDDDSNNNNQQENLRVKQTIETMPDGSQITSTANYVGNKIQNIMAGDGTGLYFTYANDVISKIEYKIGNQVFQTDNYEYDNNSRLVKYTSFDLFDDTAIKELYTHNANGNISVSRFSGDLLAQDTAEGTSTITMTNGEVSSITSNGMTRTYTYDTKNNPFKNVSGLSKISFTNGEAQGNMRNILTDTYDGQTQTTLYTYDNNTNFPLTATTSSPDGNSVTQFIYE